MDTCVLPFQTAILGDMPSMPPYSSAPLKAAKMARAPIFGVSHSLACFGRRLARWPGESHCCRPSLKGRRARQYFSFLHSKTHNRCLYNHRYVYINQSSIARADSLVINTLCCISSYHATLNPQTCNSQSLLSSPHWPLLPLLKLKHALLLIFPLAL
jgi:hypothetical protein